MKFVIKILVNCIFLFSFSEGNYLYAQDSFSDSLKNLILKSKEDTVKAMYYIKLSRHFSRDRYRLLDAKNYADSAAKLSKKSNFQKGIILHWVQHGIIESKKSGFINAIRFYNIALQISDNTSDKYYKENILHNIGTMWRKLDDYEEALKFYFEAILLAKKKNNRKIKLYSLNGIGNCYYSLKNYKEAMRSYIEALSLAKQLNNKRSEAINLNNIGDIFEAKGDYDKANEYYGKSLEINFEIGDKRGISISNTSMGNLYYKEQEYFIALELFKDALKEEEDLGSMYYKSIEYINIGKTYLKLSKDAEINKNINIDLINDAKVNLNKGYKIAKNISSLANMRDVYKYFAELHSYINEYDSSYYYLQKYIKINDSIINADIHKAASIVHKKYYIDRARDNISLLIDINKKEKEQKQELIYIVILSCVCLVIILIFFMLYKDRKRKLKANKELKKLIKEKEILIAEIHHRVKNNLAIISALIQFQIQKFNKENAIGALLDTKNRIMSFSIIHENLYQSEMQAEIDFDLFLEKQVKIISETYIGNNIKTIINANRINLELNTAVALGLITNEFLINAYTHAFPDGRDGKININLNKKDEKYIMKISDNGIGLPENFNMKKVDSAGFLIISLYLKQLKADLTTENKNGATFIIKFSPQKMKVWK